MKIKSFEIQTSLDIAEFAFAEIAESGVYEVVVVHLSLTPYGSGATGSLATAIRFTDEVGAQKLVPAPALDLSQPTRQSGRVTFSAKAGTQVRLFTIQTGVTGSISYLIKVALNRLDA